MKPIFHSFSILFALAFSVQAQVTHAQTDYPNRAITLVVPFAAGASTDTLARVIGKSISENLKQPVVIENKSGAGGLIAIDYLKRKAPDGYTFMLTTDGILSINHSIYKSLPYDSIKDFSPLMIAAIAPVVLIVKEDSPFKSVKDIIDYAKSHPANSLTFGSSGIGTSQHVAGELFNTMVGVKINHVPYKGGAPALVDLMGGHISMMFGQIPSAKEAADNGKIRILAIGSPQRHPVLPDTPTLDELGLKGYNSDTWYGFSMPAGAHPKVVSVLYEALNDAITINKSSLEKQGYVVMQSTPQQMTDNIKQNTEKWKQVLKNTNAYQMQ